MQAHFIPNPETEATTNKVQSDVTKALGERLHDIHFWKSELEREINDIISETDLLLAQKKRLDHALLATEIPMHIATDNLNCRQRRQGIDLVQDEVELSLLKVGSGSHFNQPMLVLTNFLATFRTL